MKKFFSIIFFAFVLVFVNTIQALAVTPEDFKQVIKNTKKMQKLSVKGDLEKLSAYFSEDYKSFDGFSKEEMLKIYEASSKLYPNLKSRETIQKVDSKDDTIEVYLEEKSRANLDVKGKYAMYASKNKIKGRFLSYTSYKLKFKKEGDKWLLITDEIFDETTEIRYGEVIKSDFSFELPETISSNEEYTAKLTIEPPIDRYLVASIGHDKVVFPPEKNFDPYRAVDKTGILERIMIANNEGKNEYVNTTFAFITPTLNIKDLKTKEEIKRAAISGMGIYIKRLNVSSVGL